MNFEAWKVVRAGARLLYGDPTRHHVSLPSAKRLPRVPRRECRALVGTETILVAQADTNAGSAETPLE